jgi:hypothetical protein
MNLRFQYVKKEVKYSIGNQEKEGTDFKRNAAGKITFIQVLIAIERGGEKFLKSVETKRLITEEVTKAFDGRLSEGTILFTDAHT